LAYQASERGGVVRVAGLTPVNSLSAVPL